MVGHASQRRFFYNTIQRRSSPEGNASRHALLGSFFVMVFLREWMGWWRCPLPAFKPLLSKHPQTLGIGWGRPFFPYSSSGKRSAQQSSQIPRWRTGPQGVGKTKKTKDGKKVPVEIRYWSGRFSGSFPTLLVEGRHRRRPTRARPTRCGAGRAPVLADRPLPAAQGAKLKP